MNLNYVLTHLFLGLSTPEASYGSCITQEEKHALLCFFPASFPPSHCRHLEASPLYMTGLISCQWGCYWSWSCIDQTCTKIGNPAVEGPANTIHSRRRWGHKYPCSVTASHEICLPNTVGQLEGHWPCFLLLIFWKSHAFMEEVLTWVGVRKSLAAASFPHFPPCLCRKLLLLRSCVDGLGVPLRWGFPGAASGGCPFPWWSLGADRLWLPHPLLAGEEAQWLGSQVLVRRLVG